MCNINIKKGIGPLFHFSLRSCSSINPAISKHAENKVILNKNSVLPKSADSPYYFEEGLRKVYPYYFYHQTFCKGRWINKKIIDVYLKEFGLYPKDELIKRISNGIISVNDVTVSPDYVLKNQDSISSIVHRHELPVLACPVKILFEDDDLVVVDKPPSIPVHPCGMYFQNSIVRILENEYNMPKLLTLYRLDRLASGVLCFARCHEKSRDFHDQMFLRFVSKEYVCRVEGNFPEGSVVCDKPIKHFYHNSIGTSLIHKKGKPSVTEFKKLSYNGKSSLVLCKPLTGRTHQIRIHLQYLGHPILNDFKYNSFVYGPDKGKDGNYGKSTEQLLEDLSQEGLNEIKYTSVYTGEKLYLCNTIFKEHYNMSKNSLKLHKDELRIIFCENCYFCELPDHDPVQNSLGIFLHALKYKGAGGWEFSSGMPFWAADNWNLC